MTVKGTKLKMSQIFKEDRAIPVTVIQLEKEFEKDSLAEGMKVKVSGTSKGKGFQGVVKRHGFGGGPVTHGQKNRLRAPGSIGDTAKQRVVLGRKMAGHMGSERVTLKNLEVIGIDLENKILTLKGAVPGMRGTKIEINF